MDQNASAGTDHEPYVRLPRATPRWLQRVATVQTALDLTVLAVAVLAFAAGTVLLVIDGIT